METVLAAAALVVASLSLGLQVLHMRRDPNVPEIGPSQPDEYASWTGV